MRRLAMGRRLDSEVEGIQASSQGRGRGFRVVRLALVLGAMLWCLAAPGLAGAAQTVVSLTFDDGKASQYQVRDILAAHGMHGTFYINSPAVGTSYSMSWEQLDGLAADGNEIGGHTLEHLDLTTVTLAEATHQVCDDRAALVTHGFNPVSFAYPFGASNAALAQIVHDCGYSSGRGVGGLWTDCAGCAYAETFPPANPYITRSAGSPTTSTTLADLQSWVTEAEQHGGGWVQITFHQICDACEDYSTPLPTLTAFIDWLQPRAATGTFVQTVQQAIATVPDATAPVSSVACNGSACTTDAYTADVTVSLAATDAGGAGLASTRYTTDGSDPTATSALYTAPFSVAQTTTVKYRSWDNADNAEATRTQVITITPPATGGGGGGGGGGAAVPLSAIPTVTAPTVPLQVTTPVPTIVLKAVFGKTLAQPTSPTAGKWFTFTLAVNRSDTGKPLFAGKLKGTPFLAGKALKHSTSFAKGKARLSLFVPKSAKSKRLTFKIAFTLSGHVTTRTVAFKVR